MSSDNKVSQLRSSMQYDSDTFFAGTRKRCSPTGGGGGIGAIIIHTASVLVVDWDML